MTDSHPITPPPELVRQWNEEALSIPDPLGWSIYIATQAANWSADRQLKMCEKWLRDHVSDFTICMLHVAMRPKPPSLAEQALEALKAQIDTSFKISSEAQERADLIRAALERLQELETGDE